MHDYPYSAKVWWWAAALLGAAAIVASLVGISHLDSAHLLAMVVGVALAAIAGVAPVTIPGTKLSVSAAEVPVFLLLLAVGPDAAVLAAAAEAACISLRTSKRWTSWVASPAMAAIAMYTAAHLFRWLDSSLPATGGDDVILARIVLLLLVATEYFAVGTLLIVSLLKLKRGEPLAPLTVLANHLSLGVGYACSAVIAGLLFIGFAGRPSVAAAAVAILLTVMLVSSLHLHHRRAA